MVTVSKEFYISEAPELFAQFLKIVEPSCWKGQLTAIRKRQHQNKLLAGHLESTNRVVLTLDLIEKLFAEEKTLANLDFADASVYETFALIAQTVHLHKHFQSKQKSAFVGRVKGCFRNPRDLEGLGYELGIAVHFLQEAFKVDFPELLGSGTFDWLCTRGGKVLEVECKTVAIDSGTGLNREETLGLLNKIQTRITPLIHSLKTFCVVRVLLSRSAKSAYQFHESIVDGVVSALFLDREEKSDNAQITRREFPLIDAPFPLTDPPQTEKLSRLLQDFLRKEFGPTYRETVYLFKPHKYAVALVVESAGENRQIEKFFDVAKEAAKAQLTKNYPGLICIRIEGMQANDLRETVARELVGVEFRASATDFLNDPRFAHVAGLAFTADGGVISSNNERFQQQGATYFFNNPNNELGRDPDFKIFPSH